MVKPRGLVVGAVQLCTWCAVRGPATRARLVNRLLLSLTPSALCPRNKRYYLPVPVHARAVTLVVVSRVARHGSCFGVSVHTRARSAWSGSTSSCTSAVVLRCGVTLGNGSSEYGSIRRGQGAGGLASRRWNDRLRLQNNGDEAKCNNAKRT